MIKDIIKHNGKEYQLSTVNINGCFETAIFPIKNGVPIGEEVYMWRAYNADESQDKHRDILNRSEKYLSDESIAEYLKSKEEWFYDEEVKMNCFKDKYGAELGIQVTCQRCKRQIFRRKTNIDEFEPMPRGWKVNYDFHYHGWWCPDCVKEYTI